ncbi:MAG: bile acid:sodium symporter family protein [Pseudomonadales bacterium]|nr:bile acid:sodium symporter family protein [Pseudomonadales bacterium]
MTMSRFNSLFPLWAILLSLIAFFAADAFVSLQSLIVPLLATIMFVMGLNLTQDDFARIASDPKPIFIGVLLQFLLMPLLALTLSAMLQLSNQLTAGMVLVGSCAGGTASNVISYLAKADLALSISMTVTSTLVGVLATPFLCTFYLSQTIEVDTWAMLISILQMVFVPVLAGALINHYATGAVQRVEALLPSLSIVLILLIIAIVVALNSERLIEVGILTLLAVIIHNLGGLLGGFYLSRLLGLNVKQSHTIAIEVGMQNSGLGVALALQFFSATAALPGALFSVWHNISGSILASYWSRKRESLEYILRDDNVSSAE